MGISSVGLLEVVWAIGLRYTDGWTKLRASVFTAVAMFVDFVLLLLALKDCVCRKDRSRPDIKAGFVFHSNR